MKKTVVIVTIILLVVNLLAGLMLSGYKPFNVAFTSAIIVLTGSLIYLLQVVPMKNAFMVSLSFLFLFVGGIEFVLGLLSPKQFQDNGYILGAICLLAIEGLFVTICSITSKTLKSHE